jgi:ribonucleotide reductase beta subunit family protein with ferritin-like domain
MFRRSDNKILCDHLDVMQNLFWKANEINYLSDKPIFDNLSIHLQQAIIAVNNFFVHADDLVNKEIGETILAHLKSSDKIITIAYQYIEMIEGIHLQSYSDYVDLVLPEPQRSMIINKTFPLTNRLYDFSSMLYKKYKDNLPMLLVCQIIIEGIFFSGAWLLVFWIKNHIPSLSAFTKANERINKDENTHIQWSIILIKYFRMNLPAFEVLQLFSDAVDIAVQVYKEDVLPNDLDTLNKNMFETHIKYIADEELKLLGFTPMYNVGDTFEFMKTIDYGVRITDFFTSISLDYGKNYTMSDSLNNFKLITF